ncbi:tripartite tricarboxylate transporter substrate binding protein [Xenophilus arseniciresistens]|uniref:Tripartite tricarboxylate transporter substrate binding protein n=1 Tax=Xenophilus arseniciresistens TaxID=1283306 RepID=A0AAE3SZ76_9BURK|nr:tripartite tricarboxylate transporter substrate binding protein [Xenophilus arseniciresistens]MDA7416867.1 tripartite tricarboxylate transporter substrate binding protein [Xenophilus arseniciresistens]
MTKKRLLATLLLAGTFAAHAQNAERYPERPVTLIVPTAPAGGTDTIARLFADALGKAMKQSFVVDNRPGANGILGTETAARAAPDGYRLLFTYAATMAINPSLYKKLPYDPLKDFAPIAQIGRGGNLLMVRKDLPVNTVKEFVAYVKARPDNLSYCSWGAGSGGHLAMESLKKQAGLVMTHVPYKGTAPCVQDLLGSQVDAAFADISSTVEIARSGRVKVLAYGGAGRMPMLPDVPTMTEAGYPFSNYSWYGLFAPAKTPPAIVKRLNEAVNQALKDPAVVQRMRELNFTDLPVETPEQFAATIRQDLNDWGSLVKAVGLSLD